MKRLRELASRFVALRQPAPPTLSKIAKQHVARLRKEAARRRAEEKRQRKFRRVLLSISIANTRTGSALE